MKQSAYPSPSGTKPAFSNFVQSQNAAAQFPGVPVALPVHIVSVTNIRSLFNFASQIVL